MISTYLSYNLVARDMKASMNQVAQESQVSREAQYFRDNIGKVTTAKEFVDDYRLYSYAMKAHGLEEMTYAKAFMLKVVESDLSDSNSYANKLTDKRYREFAAAFQFSSNAVTVMSESQMDQAIGLYGEHFASQDDLIAADTNYYKAMAAKVETVDQFLADPRLREYMLQSYGIDSGTADRTFLRAILTSDLSDPSSYYNTQLAGQRDAALAVINSHQPVLTAIAARQTAIDERAYIVSLQTAIGGAETELAAKQALLAEPGADADALQIEIDNLTATIHLRYADFAEYGLFAMYDEQADLVANGQGDTPEAQALDAKITAWTAEYDSRWSIINSIQSIANLKVALAEPGADTVAIQAEIDAERASIATTTSGLVVGASDVTQMIADKDAEIASYTDLPAVGEATTALSQALYAEANQASTYLGQTDKYVTLVAAYNFNPDGSVPAEGFQSAEQLRATTEIYIFSQDRLTRSGALLNDQYFRETIGTFTTVDEMMADARIVDFLKSAFNLKTSLSVVSSTLANAITTASTDADLEDPNNYLVRFHSGRDYYDDLVALSRAFNFNEDGTLPDGVPPVDAAKLDEISSRYFSGYDDVYEEDDELAIKRLKLDLTALADSGSTVDDLFKSSGAYNFVMTAVGLDAKEVPQRIMRKVLTSDLTDPKSFVYTLKDDRYVQFAKLFNFDESGKFAAPLAAQDNATIQQVAKDYIIHKARFLKGDEATSAKSAAQDEARYYADTIAKVESLDGLLANRRLLDFALEAKGLNPGNFSDKMLRQAFTSNLSDPKSYANQFGDHRLAELVASFNFDSSGKLTRPESGVISSRGSTVETMNMFLRQTMEEQQGIDNEGVRLALYFERMAPTITSAYDILSDTALYAFFKATYSMPAEISGMDVDKQAALVEKYLNLSDLADPQKLSDLVERFTIMYDLSSNDTSTSLASVLFGNSSADVSFDTLMSLSQLNRR
jgi:uncharacterized protein DUF1217